MKWGLCVEKVLCGRWNEQEGVVEVVVGGGKVEVVVVGTVEVAVG